MSTLLQRLANNPNVIIEEVRKDVPWRAILSKYDDEATVDEFLLWAKHNKPLIAAFVNKTIEHVKQREKVSAITITDEIKCNHNRSRFLAVVAMVMSKECKGYFNIREKRQSIEKVAA